MSWSLPLTHVSTLFFSSSIKISRHLSSTSKIYATHWESKHAQLAYSHCTMCGLKEHQKQYQVSTQKGQQLSKKKKKRMWVVKKVKAQEERINKMGKTEKTCYLNHESCNKISFPTHINDCCSGSHSPFPPNNLLWPKTHRCIFCSPWQFSDTFHGFK